MPKMQATTNSVSKNSIGHWGRVAAMLLSGGFIFPHAMTEGDDIVVKTDVVSVATAKND